MIQWVLAIYARIYRRLFWSKEDRERLEYYLGLMDKQIEQLDQLIAGEKLKKGDAVYIGDDGKAYKS